MELVFIYLLKSSGLIAVFYLAYYFLLRKETFFNSNRWFLLSGLVTSLLLPLYFLQKIIVVERPKIVLSQLTEPIPQPMNIVPDIPAVETYDWTLLLWIGYGIITALLLIKILFNLVSLYRMLYNRQIVKKEQFKLVDLNDNIAPFSFFNYIVYNAKLYSDEELESILLHEKIHSKEKHSLDVLVAETLCALFWFNPFIWLYKKAITQNLEYIADQKAIQKLSDKKSYQHALLKVVSNQNCLPITNNFYQSLIKKRIIMLNQNQSHRRSSWKYAVIIPALISFVFLFQVKVVAQDKFIPTTNDVASANEPTSNQDTTKEETTAALTTTRGKGSYVFDKTETDENLKDDAADIEQSHNISFVISNIKRNNNGEIIYAKNTMLNDTMFSCGEIEWFEIDGKLRKPIKDKYDWYDIENIRTDGKFELILSSTWDLTTKQNREYLNLCFKIFDLKNDKSVCRYADTPLSMRYLFINHIDAFDLIGNNQAIDKKKVLHLFS